MVHWWPHRGRSVDFRASDHTTATSEPHPARFRPHFLLSDG